jgi:hypothetical protein
MKVMKLAALLPEFSNRAAKLLLPTKYAGPTPIKTRINETRDGLENRNPLFEKILSYVFPTSPKLDLALQNRCP